MNHGERMSSTDIEHKDGATKPAADLASDVASHEEEPSRQGGAATQDSRGDAADRERTIVRTSVGGILTNVALVAFKSFIGFASGSVAIILDAVNNLTDVLSSVVTIVGIHMASRPADRAHPYGHGRIEYFASMIVAAIIFFAGVSSFWESIQKVLNPELPQYSAPMLVIIAVATVAKVVLGRCYKRVGKRVASDTLIASGADATFDAVISAGTLVAALVAMVWQVSVDGLLGLAISVVIVRSGWQMFERPMNDLLGAREDASFYRQIRADISTFKGVEGVYDLVLHDYGPERHMGACNIGVADTMTAHEINDLTHDIQRLMRGKYGVDMIVGIHAINTHDEHYAQVEERVRAIVERYLGVRQVHGIYIDDEHRDLSVDVLLDFDVADPRSIHNQIQSDLEGAWPGYVVHVRIDRDYSE